ncbi:hypothetical protein LJC58_10030 [Lachnospiraceae bacterium OttesenSCG-928-D06]|nr:hypothetical protein [Lachnospiraceae bacterium OttesenSCG-928-D06]
MKRTYDRGIDLKNERQRKWFKELYMNHYEDLMVFAFRITNNTNVSELLVHKVFLDALHCTNDVFLFISPSDWLLKQLFKYLHDTPFQKKLRDSHQIN